MAAPAVEATLLFANGKIAAIGPDLDLPEGTVRVDGEGKHIYPGMFCAAGQLGLVEINSVRATRDEAEVGRFNPNVRVEVAVNPESGADTCNASQRRPADACRAQWRFDQR